mmetsp:Transcript_71883/g.127000  ORF Transcript_71883/g.127000 Transcript_71883/m.127000 type:complete len:162 (+) Transcript_71883:73-558(+)
MWSSVLVMLGLALLLWRVSDMLGNKFLHNFDQFREILFKHHKKMALGLVLATLLRHTAFAETVWFDTVVDTFGLMAAGGIFGGLVIISSMLTAYQFGRHLRDKMGLGTSSDDGVALGFVYAAPVCVLWGAACFAVLGLKAGMYGVGVTAAAMSILCLNGSG